MEKGGRYVNKGFGEGGEDAREGFDESDFEFIGDFYVNKSSVGKGTREPFLKVFFEEVL